MPAAHVVPGQSVEKKREKRAGEKGGEMRGRAPVAAGTTL